MNHQKQGFQLVAVRNRTSSDMDSPRSVIQDLRNIIQNRVAADERSLSSQLPKCKERKIQCTPTDGNYAKPARMQGV